MTFVLVKLTKRTIFVKIKGEITDADDIDRAIIAGHYIFSSNEFIELKAKANAKINNLDGYLKNKVKESIFRYMNAFNLT